MGLYQRLQGIVGNFFQLGGPGGPGLDSTAGGISAQNATQSAFVNVRGAYPLIPDDLTTKKYVDEIFKPLIVTAQANAPSALIANTGVAHYIVVSTPGTGAAAAYVAGAVLYDNGTSVGNVDIIGPTVGGSIVTTVALVGGTFTFNANNEYVWTVGSVWQNISPSVAGVVSCIDFAIGTDAAQPSVTSIPANAVVLRCDVTITTPYSVGGTIQVGQTGTTNLLQDTPDNFPSTAGEYSALQRTGWGAAALPVLVTVGGAPAVGAGHVTVEYSLPQA